MYYYENGNKYDGEYLDNKRNGKGTFTWGEKKWRGDKYVGDWVQDKRHGRGK